MFSDQAEKFEYWIEYVIFTPETNVNVNVIYNVDVKWIL